MYIDRLAEIFHAPEEVDPQKWIDGWRAIEKVPRNNRWGRQHTEVLKSIALPRWSDASKAISSESDDRLGDVWLPPRLHIADEIRTLECGVLFCATGGIEYAEKQVVPMIRHLIDNLGILPDAKERAACERGAYIPEEASKDSHWSPRENLWMAH